MTVRAAALLLAITLATGCASAKRYGSLAVEDAKAFARSRPSGTTFIAASAIVASAVLDEGVRNAVHHTDDNDDVSEVVGPFGGRYGDRVIAGFIIAGAATNNSRAKAVAFDSLVSSLVASKIITPVLKEVVGRSRPNESDHAFEFGEGGDSFPSNHSTQAFAIASVIAAHYESRWIDGAAYGLAALVGASRIYDNAHWSSDVVAGAVIGTATGRLVVRTNNSERMQWSVTPIVDGKRRGISIRLSRAR